MHIDCGWSKVKVSFDVPNSLAGVLGFERSIYGVGRHASESLINIMSVKLHSGTLQHYSLFIHAWYNQMQLLDKRY